MPGRLDGCTSCRPRQLREAGAAPLLTGIKYDDDWNHDNWNPHAAVPIHLMVPAVNSFTIAASFILSALFIYVEVFNVVQEIPAADTRALQWSYVLMAVQYGLNSMANQAVYAAADQADEKKGAVPPRHWRSPRSDWEQRPKQGSGNQAGDPQREKYV